MRVKHYPGTAIKPITTNRRIVRYSQAQLAGGGALSDAQIKTQLYSYFGFDVRRRVLRAKDVDSVYYIQEV